MFLDIFKKKPKKPVWPVEAQYKFRDFVRFRHRGELHFGFVHEARVENGEVIYTLQMGGECPTFVYDYKEDQIVGKVN
jgi:hypothetical protein